MCVCRYVPPTSVCFLFFFNDPATTGIYTLSLHDALPISATAAYDAGRNRDHSVGCARPGCRRPGSPISSILDGGAHFRDVRSEEHTSELQSQSNLVCRLLLEKKNKIPYFNTPLHTGYIQP